MRRITRRQAVLEALLGAGAVALGGCGGGARPLTGSTLQSTWVDPVSDGQLRVRPGEALIVPSAIVGVLLERLVFGPELARLAAGYAELPLHATVAEVLVTVAGLAVAAGLAVVWVARQASREPVVSGLAAP